VFECLIGLGVQTETYYIFVDKVTQCYCRPIILLYIIKNDFPTHVVRYSIYRNLVIIIGKQPFGRHRLPASDFHFFGFRNIYICLHSKVSIVASNPQTRESGLCIYISP
jgi:hypothetical protein